MNAMDPEVLEMIDKYQYNYIYGPGRTGKSLSYKHIFEKYEIKNMNNYIVMIPEQYLNIYSNNIDEIYEKTKIMLDNCGNISLDTIYNIYNQQPFICRKKYGSYARVIFDKNMKICIYSNVPPNKWLIENFNIINVTKRYDDNGVIID